MVVEEVKTIGDDGGCSEKGEMESSVLSPAVLSAALQ